jgi:hypothetical protein
MASALVNMTFSLTDPFTAQADTVFYLDNLRIQRLRR